MLYRYELEESRSNRYKDLFDKNHRLASNAKWLVNTLKGAGPLLLITGIVVDIWGGDSTEKAVISNLAGAGAATAALVLLTGPLGMGIIAASAIAIGVGVLVTFAAGKVWNFLNPSVNISPYWYFAE